MKKMKGIRKRWMMNNISAALVIVLLAVTAFSVAMVSYYYSSMSRGLEEQARQVRDIFAACAGDAEINVLCGGQPVYSYLVSVE